MIAEVAYNPVNLILRFCKEKRVDFAHAFATATTRRILSGSFRTRAASITEGKAEQSRGRKKFSVDFIVNTSDFLYNGSIVGVTYVTIKHVLVDTDYNDLGFLSEIG